MLADELEGWHTQHLVSYVADRVATGEPEEVLVAEDDGVGQPPAIAPTTRNGSRPSTTAAGSGSSGDSWERSSSQA